MGLVEFDGFFAADVAAYRAAAGLTAVPLKTVLLDGMTGAAGGNNAEVSLDIDMANSMAPGLASIIVYEGAEPDDILGRMAADNSAKQLSASWLYATDAETEQIFLEFAAQGQSFFNAAGDYDAYVGGVDAPADDPNITIVGGTTLSTTGPLGAWVAEQVWNWNDGTGTGGGISTTYAIPSWQAPVNMGSNGGSAVWRNLPDVALTADNIWLFYDDGTGGSFGGTSCATPLWAGFIALVNQQAVANGQTTQGFINPAVYGLGLGSNYAALFHDITVGANTNGSSPALFQAVAGFDLCTGWGTPAGTNLIHALAPPDELQILPGAGYTANGGRGGPFSIAQGYLLLTNTGAGVVGWAAGTKTAWLAVAPANGVLAPGATAFVGVSLNAAASNMVAGNYAGTVAITNLADGAVQARAFQLNILTAPSITAQPTNQTVLGGAAVAIQAGVIGGVPMICQWQRNGTNLTDGGTIAGLGHDGVIDQWRVGVKCRVVCAGGQQRGGRGGDDAGGC